MLTTRENNEFNKWWHDWVSSREQIRIEMQQPPTGMRSGVFAADEEAGKPALEPDVAPETNVV